MSDEAEDVDLTGTLLLFVATDSELQELGAALNAEGFTFVAAEHHILGVYYKIGQIGKENVIAVKTEMGSVYPRSSAFFANSCRVAIGASGVIQLGMAFGIDPGKQRYNDVLVSSRIFPYDVRDVNSEEVIDEDTLAISRRVVVDYSNTRYGRPSDSLLRVLQRGADRLKGLYRVHFGTLLSGQARIRARAFRDELVQAVLNSGHHPANHPIIGGEMEGAGLLSAATDANKFWIVVKGICDFADEERDAVIEDTRRSACRNAATFVIQSLQIVR